MLTPKTLFKFRKIDGNCFRLISNRELWYASPSTFNDPFEGESSFSEVLESVWEKYPLPESERALYFEKIQRTLNESGICSFSKTRKNQHMWAHYADEHKGLCIGFKEELLRPLDSSIFPIDVTYQSNYPFAEIIKRFNYFEQFPGQNSVGSVAGDIIYSILSTKYTSWRYEKERRLLFCRSEAIPFCPNAINSVAFGLRTPEKDKTAIRAIMSGTEWKHVQWYQAVKSKTKYALEFERI